jgi:hypothetical protein
MARVSSNPARSGIDVDFHPPTPALHRRPKAHAIIAKSKVTVSISLRPGDMGETGGSGRVRGVPTEGAVVVTVTVTLVAELPAVAGFGETVQVASDGAPAQVNVTGPDNPP